jgi:PPOX class probable F420-dependent enzyme
VPASTVTIMDLTAHLDTARRTHVEARLRGNLIARFTTVRDDGQPTSVPVWFLLRDDDSLRSYTQPGARKLHTLELNRKMVLGLDVTDVGRDNIRVEGVVRRDDAIVPADQNPSTGPRTSSGSVRRWMDTGGTPEQFAEAFTVPLVVTPTRVRA